MLELCFFRKIFGFSKWKSVVKRFICGLDGLDIHHITRHERVKLDYHAMHMQHLVVKYVFWLFLCEQYCKGCNLSTVFKRKHVFELSLRMFMLMFQS